jgi:hypothetical protein
MIKKVVVIVSIICLFSTINIFTDEKTKNLQSIVLEDFELAEGGQPKRIWVAVPSLFGREENKESGKSLEQVSWVEAWPEAYFGREGIFDDGNGPKPNKTSLSLKVQFNRQGYNYVELYPCVTKDGKLVTEPINFKGIVKQIDMWIWGANYNYDVEFVLMDYKGIEHRLPVGNIKHVGWKNFVVGIPGYIPQTGTYVLGQYQFSLVKIVVWTTPKEKVSGTYVYFDHIKYLSDIFQEKYDGYNLGDINTVKNLQEKAPKAPDDSQLRQQQQQ